MSDWNFTIYRRRIDVRRSKYVNYPTDWPTWIATFKPNEFPGGGRVKAEREFAVLTVTPNTSQAMIRKLVRANVRAAIDDRCWNRVKVPESDSAP